MATKNRDKTHIPVGVRPIIGDAKATAVTADDTAGTLTIVITDIPPGGSIGNWVAQMLNSDNVPTALDVTLSGKTFTIADDTATVAAGDIYSIIYTIDYI